MEYSQIFEAGWIPLPRDIRNHWIWDDPIKFKRWIDILLTVNHADKEVNIGLKVFECKRGQTIRSLTQWAKRWGVSRDTVRNFLMLLENHGMIVHKNLYKTTRITVCHYDNYQSALHGSLTHDDRKPDENRNKQERVNNEKKIVIDEIEINETGLKGGNYSDFMQKFNKVRKSNFTTRGKKVRGQYDARIKDGFSDQEMIQALKNFMNDDFHIQNGFKYLTPEFITRSDKLEKGLNLQPIIPNQIKIMKPDD